MPGSILFAGICAVVYFVVGIRFGNELMADDCTSIGEFSVLLLIVILSALLVNSYCKKASVVWYIGGIGVGGTLLALLFSFYVIPFDITWFQYGLCVVLLFYLIFLSMHERMRNYFYIALFAIGSVGFFFLPIMFSIMCWSHISRYVLKWCLVWRKIWRGQDTM